MQREQVTIDLPGVIRSDVSHKISFEFGPDFYASSKSSAKESFYSPAGWVAESWPPIQLSPALEISFFQMGTISFGDLLRSGRPRRPLARWGPRLQRDDVSADSTTPTRMRRLGVRVFSHRAACLRLPSFALGAPGARGFVREADHDACPLVAGESFPVNDTMHQPVGSATSRSRRQRRSGIDGPL